MNYEIDEITHRPQNKNIWGDPDGIKTFTVKEMLESFNKPNKKIEEYKGYSRKNRVRRKVGV